MIIETREMKYSDLAFATKATRARGHVSEAMEDLQGLLESDATGCFIAEQGRKPIGFCIATRYDKCGSLGAIPVSGIEGEAVLGRMLVVHALRYLLSRRCTRVIAEAELSSVSSFENAGFARLCRVLRFVGNVYARTHHHVRALRSRDLSAVKDLDRHSFRTNRWYFLKRRISLTPQYCKVVELNGRVRGYVMARRRSGVVVVGPWVVSPTVDCPADLLEGLAVETSGERLLIQVLETNHGAIELLRAMGFTELPESTWRMFCGRGRNVGIADSLFAIGSPFLG